MIRKVTPDRKPHSTIQYEVLIKTADVKPYYGAYFSGYYCNSRNTWLIYSLNDNSAMGATYVPISEDCIAYYIMLEKDEIKEG
jgi:hypothetical protein